MTISNTSTKNIYSGNGVATIFAFTFPIADESELEVYLLESGFLTLKTLNTDYTIAGVGNPSGGNVTFVTPPPTVTGGSDIVLVRKTPLTQLADYIEGDSFPAETHEAALDKLTKIAQEHAEALARAAQLPVNSSEDVETLSQAILLVADNSTNINTVATDIANINTVATDIANVNAVATNIANVNAVATNETNINAIAANEANINAVAANEANINAVAASEANINAAVADLPALSAKVSKTGDVMTGLLNLAAGADIASASTVDLTAATGNCPKITGTTAITAFTMNVGQQMKCLADGALPLTYHATTNNIEGGASYTCAAGDIINLVKGLDGVVRVRIEKQDGTPVVNPSYVGEIFDWPHASTPSYALLCNGAQVSRTTYAALFAVIGTTWGVGDGSTTFNLPNIPEGYTTVQANANEGTSTVGEVIAHTHSYQSLQTPTNAYAYGNGHALTAQNTGSTGGSANRAAGVYVRKCIRF